jgi:hypothetical protein
LVVDGRRHDEADLLDMAKPLAMIVQFRRDRRHLSGDRPQVYGPAGSNYGAFTS